MVSDEQIMEIAKELQGLSPEEQQTKFQELVKDLSPEEQKEVIEKLSGGGGSGECPFCLMAEGKIDVFKVYEDSKVIAILDIKPATKGHIILFPKEHASLLAQVDDETVGHMFKIANKLAGIVFEAVKAEGTNIVVANGAVAGQRGPHVLVNIIPRFKDDKVAVGWNGADADENELKELANELNSKAQNLAKKDEPVVEEKQDFEEEPRIP